MPDLIELADARQAQVIALGVRNFPVRVFFSTLKAGNMAPKPEGENQRVLFETLRLSLDREVHLRPRHGTEIVRIGSNEAGRQVDCDGLITSEQPLTLTSFPADAFPVVITSENGRFVVLINAEIWGVAGRIINKAFTLIRSSFTPIEPNELRVVIGPGIRTCHYKTTVIEEEMRDPELWEQYVGESNHVDLARCIRDHIVEEGVPTENIFDTTLCTWCALARDGENPLFFSQLRADRQGGESGRFAAIVTRSLF